MFRKIVIALIVVSSLGVGYGVFTGSITQAASSCFDANATYLAANPELLKVGCSEITANNEVNMQPANEAYSGLAAFYAANPELMAHKTYEVRHNNPSALYATNPELMAHSRYAIEVE